MKINYIAISYSGLKRVGPHKHDSWEIILNLAGTGMNYMGDDISEFKPGSISICPPGVYHYKTSNDGYFQDIYATFNDNYIFRNFKRFNFEDDSDKKIETLFLMINNIYHEKEKGYEIVSGLLWESICNMLAVRDIGSKPDEKATALKNEIIQNFTNADFSIESAMKRINYNADYVRRRFKMEVGVTPVGYLNSLRIAHAKKLLQTNAHPDYLISDVAYMAGFYDAGYFSRVFKNLEGISPAEYVKKCCSPL